MENDTKVLCCSCFKKYDPNCMFCKGTRYIPLGTKRVVCPVCKGQFEKGKFCTHCVGWGYVAKDSPDAKCIHEWTHTAKLGNCFNKYTCKKCGTTKEVDSSG